MFIQLCTKLASLVGVFSFTPPFLIKLRRHGQYLLNRSVMRVLWSAVIVSGRVLIQDNRTGSQPRRWGSMYTIPHRDT